MKTSPLQSEFQKEDSPLITIETLALIAIYGYLTAAQFYGAFKNFSDKNFKISASSFFSSAYEWILYLGVMLGLWVLQKLRSGKKVYAWEVIVAALSTPWFGVSFEITP